MAVVAVRGYSRSCRSHAARQRHRHVRKRPPQEPLGGKLVLGVHEREQEAHGHRLDARAGEAPRCAGDVVLVQGLDDRSVGCDALARLEPQAVGHKRPGPRPVQVVERRPLLGSDRERVGEPRRREQAHACGAALDDRVGRHRRAVDEVVHICRRDPRERLERVDEAPREVGGVVRAFVMRRRPPRTITASVNVPPTSIPTLIRAVGAGIRASLPTRRAQVYTGLDAEDPEPGRPPHHDRGRRPAEPSMKFSEAVLGMPVRLEQPNVDNASESHLYLRPRRRRRLITVFTERGAHPRPDPDGDRPRLRPRIVALSRRTRRSRRRSSGWRSRGIRHSGVTDRGLWTQIYFEDPARASSSSRPTASSRRSGTLTPTCCEKAPPDSRGPWRRRHRRGATSPTRSRSWYASRPSLDDRSPKDPLLERALRGRPGGRQKLWKQFFSLAHTEADGSLGQVGARSAARGPDAERSPRRLEPPRRTGRRNRPGRGQFHRRLPRHEVFRRRPARIPARRATPPTPRRRKPSVRAAPATIVGTPATSRWARVLPGVAQRLGGRADSPRDRRRRCRRQTFDQPLVLPPTQWKAAADAHAAALDHCH